MSFDEFLTEGKKGLTPAGNVMQSNNPTEVGYSFDYADISIQEVRKLILDKYYPQHGTDEDKEYVDRAITTIVYAMEKKIRVDEEIVEKLSTILKISPDELTKGIQEVIQEYYENQTNLYGQTS